MRNITSRAGGHIRSVHSHEDGRVPGRHIRGVRSWIGIIHVYVAGRNGGTTRARQNYRFNAGAAQTPHAQAPNTFHLWRKKSGRGVRSADGPRRGGGAGAAAEAAATRAVGAPLPPRPAQPSGPRKSVAIRGCTQCEHSQSRPAHFRLMWGCAPACDINNARIFENVLTGGN